MAEYPKVTVHGRFQPPLHVNHWNFVKTGFDKGDHVTILITNPYLDESFDASASWRNDPAQNPFTYEERVFMFQRFFDKMSIPKERYDFKPFNIKDPASFKELDPSVPNLVNVYSEWSTKKLDAFADHGLPTVRLDQAKVKPVSGTKIREIINEHSGDNDELRTKLTDAGFMPEAIDGLLEVLRLKRDAK